MNAQLDVVGYMTRSLQFRKQMERELANRDSTGALLNHADLMTLGLLLQQPLADIIVLEHDFVAAALGSTLSRCGFEQTVLTGTYPGSGRSVLRLVEFSQLRHSEVMSDHAGPILLFGFRGFCKLENFGSKFVEFAIFPFSSQSPALWRSSLAWLVDEESKPQCELATNVLLDILKEPEFDVFRLFERVQRLETSKQLSSSSADADADLRNRILELEMEVSTLRRVGLLRQDLLIAESGHRLKTKQ